MAIKFRREGKSTYQTCSSEESQSGITDYKKHGAASKTSIPMFGPPPYSFHNLYLMSILHYIECYPTSTMAANNQLIFPNTGMLRAGIGPRARCLISSPPPPPRTPAPQMYSVRQEPSPSLFGQSYYVSFLLLQQSPPNLLFLLLLIMHGHPRLAFTISLITM